MMLNSGKDGRWLSRPSVEPHLSPRRRPVGVSRSTSVLTKMGGLMESAADSRPAAGLEQSRRIVQRTRGKTSGPFTRLASPSDVGQLIKPFVFLDYVALDSSSPTELPLHPHSGIATLTTLLQGSLHIQDSKGLPKSLHAGGIEWMQAGRGVWHGGPLSSTGPVKLYQLWVALPPALRIE